MLRIGAAFGRGGFLSPLVLLMLVGSACVRVQAIPTVMPTSAEPPSIVDPSDLPTPDPWAATPGQEVTANPEPTPGSTATPRQAVTVAPTHTAKLVLYQSQPGDTLRAIALRFGVLPSDITPADGNLPPVGDLLDPDRLLIIPSRMMEVGPEEKLLPDSELVYSPHAADFDVAAFCAGQNGFLLRYREYVGEGWRTGPEVVELAALDNSVNPRLLLALLEYVSHWVTDPTEPQGRDLSYPMGHTAGGSKGLYRQLGWAAELLGEGYYGWRSGSLSELLLPSERVVRMAPDLNAGTVALHNFFSHSTSDSGWEAGIGNNGVMSIYRSFFGDPWSYMHPLYEPGARQPEMILPFNPGRMWSFTAGPHGAWGKESPWAALDFAPTATAGCTVPWQWVVAAAPGMVVRSSRSVVVVDLDGDGLEQTGWVLVYVHIAHKDRVAVHTYLEAGDHIGHPSCEGGPATGTHVHIARKYNGEWILADGPLSFELSGWIAREGLNPGEGALVKGDRVVIANPWGMKESLIQR